MSIHRKRGRLRAAIAAAALAAGALTAVSTSAQPAAAAGACTPLFPNAISNWGVATVNSPTGVTLCVGKNSDLPDAYVQIVDLTAGAKVRLWEDIGHGVCGDQACDFGAFPVKTAQDWATWIGLNTSRPDASTLFSVSNAGFFTDTSGNPSPLSLAFEHEQLQPDGTIDDYIDKGLAFTLNTNPAWDEPKRAITFGDTLSTPEHPVQQVHMSDFPLHYTFDDILQNFRAIDSPCNAASCEFDATVGLTPDFSGGTGAKRRTYVGVSAGTEQGITTVYILTTLNDYTVSDAQQILESFGSQLEMQLDGGNSTQLFADGRDLIDSPIGRKVPMVLAVYVPKVTVAPPPLCRPRGC
jgi:Phosphodiester glycosidase